MRVQFLSLILSVSFAAIAAGQAPSPIYRAPAQAQPVPQPAASPAAPPSTPPLRSAADLEKRVAPITLSSDPLIPTLPPASAYPLEIVQAARFVENTNNLDKLNTHPWGASITDTDIGASISTAA